MNLSTPILQVFDPAMCCSTGVCGPGVDPALVQFASDLDWLKTQGIIVQRHGLSQNPGAFVTVEVVRAALAEKGEGALPILLLNGRMLATGRYPERKELAGWLNLQAVATPPAGQSGCGCSGACG